MSWIVAIIIGGIVGWLASVIMKTDAQMGLLANIIVGIVGSVLGNWIAALVGFTATGSVARFIIALVGAIILILILQQLGFFRKRAAGHRDT